MLTTGLILSMHCEIMHGYVIKDLIIMFIRAWCKLFHHLIVIHCNILFYVFINTLFITFIMWNCQLECSFITINYQLWTYPLVIFYLFISEKFWYENQLGGGVATSQIFPTQILKQHQQRRYRLHRHTFV